MAKTHAVPDSMKLGWIAERLPFKALQWLPATTTALHPPAPNAVPMDDWNVLLRAIKDRLHRSAADPAAVARPHVLDCVTALGQLQMALQQEVRTTPAPGASVARGTDGTGADPGSAARYAGLRATGAASCRAQTR